MIILNEDILLLITDLKLVIIFILVAEIMANIILIKDEQARC